MEVGAVVKRDPSVSKPCEHMAKDVIYISVNEDVGVWEIFSVFIPKFVYFQILLLQFIMESIIG